MSCQPQARNAVEDPRSGLTGKAALEACSSRSTSDDGRKGLPAGTPSRKVGGRTWRRPLAVTSKHIADLQARNRVSTGGRPHALAPDGQREAPCPVKPLQGSLRPLAPCG